MRKNLLLTFMLFCSSLAVLAQNKITGKVTSADDGSGLPGVTVQLKGAAKGTQTNVDGQYSIDANNGDVLVYSFIGMASQEIKVGKQSNYNVVLASDANSLNEIVVTGTGVAVSKRDLAFDVSAVSAKDMPNVPTNSIDQALVGKIPGAQIQSTGGMPGQPANIVLRGINTINSSTNPMYLVDGVQMSSTDFNSLDATIIDRVEVIQGASASTMYGAQGANGVIQVFTKRGKSGKPLVEFGASVTNSQYLNIGNVHKADMHGFVTDASNNVVGSGNVPLVMDPTTGIFNANLQFNSTDPTVQINKPYGANLKYYDHFKEFFVPATNKNYNVRISGGTDKSDYMISLSNNEQQSNFKNFGGLTRTNFGMNLGVELAKGLKFRSTTQMVYTDNKITQTPDEYENGYPAGRNIIYTIFNSRPFADYEYKTADGNYPAYFGDAVGVNGSNPNFWLQYSKSRVQSVDLVQSFNLNYKFARFVELDTKYGLNIKNTDAKFTYLNQSQNVNSNESQYWVGIFNTTDNTGEVSQYNGKKIFQNFLASAYLRTDFQKDFGLNIPLKTTTQVGWDYRNRNTMVYGTYGNTLPIFEPYNASQTVTQKIFTDYREPFVTYGYLFNQRFEYGNWLGLSGGFRTDYSSAFGKGSKPFTFPRADGFVRISGLDFWKNARIGKIIDDFKIRAAYGEAGIQPKPFDRYITLATKTVGADGTFYAPLAQPNSGLNVEVSRELEIGTDIGFGITRGRWFNSGTFSLSYWKRSTDNAIYNIDGAPTAGIGTVKDNAFSLASHGIQAMMRIEMLKSKDWNWDMQVNWSRQSSEITAVKGGGQVIVQSGAGSTGYVLTAGQKIGQLYGFLGVHSLDAKLPDGTDAIAEANRANYTVASNGWVVNKTTKQPYFSSKQYAMGDPNPKFLMSFIHSLTYKNFVTVGAQLDWLDGSHLYNQTKEWMYRDGISSDYTKPITIDGQTGAWSAFYRGVYAQVSRNGTKNYFYEDASFLRLRNVNLSFNLANMVKIKGFSYIKLNLSGRNLFTVTKYTGMDPEISSGYNGSAWDRGVDHNTMPNLKSYTVGLNVGL